MQVRALLFDTFGTVVDWRTSIVREFEAFGRDKGIAFDWASFVDEWKTAYRPGMDAVREGRAPWTTVDATYAYLGFAPEETMMVAAHNYDLRAARSHGMRTAFVARPTEYGPGQKTDLKAEQNWDVIARDFGELAAKLGT